MAVANTASRLQPARPRPLVLLVFLLVGGLLGGTAGLAAARAHPQLPSAKAVISVALPSALDQDVPAPQEDPTAMVQSELIVLSGPSLHRDVEKRLGGSEPVSYTAVQVGSSTIVSVTAEAATSARALSSVQAVIAAYSVDREARLRAQVDRAAAIVDGELSRLEKSLSDDGLGASALRGEYGRLLAVRSGLYRATADVQQSVTVVQAPTASGGGVPPVTRDGALGALVGAVLAVLLLMLVNRLTRRVRSGADLAGGGFPVLHPELRHHSGGLEDFAGQGPAARALRLLVAQLVRPGRGGVLVLLGATSRVGTSFTAAAAAVCLSERSDVLLVLAADVIQGRDGTAAHKLGVAGADRGLTTAPTGILTPGDVFASAVSSSVPGVLVLARGPGDGDRLLLRELSAQGLLDACIGTGMTVVVDAPSLSDSTTTVDFAERAGGAVLVVGRYVTHRADVETVQQMFERQAIPLLGALLVHPRRAHRLGARVAGLRRSRDPQQSPALPGGPQDLGPSADAADAAPEQAPAVDAVELPPAVEAVEQAPAVEAVEQPPAIVEAVEQPPAVEAVQQAPAAATAGSWARRAGRRTGPSSTRPVEEAAPPLVGDEPTAAAGTSDESPDVTAAVGALDPLQQSARQ